MRKVFLLILSLLMVVQISAIPAALGNSTTPPASVQGLLVSQGLQNLRVTWSANSDSDLAGYVVYWGTSSTAYTQSYNVGKVLSYQIMGLTDNTKYYIAVKAYDIYSNYSPYSEQVSGKPGFPNLGPSASITSINPNTGNEGDIFNFSGQGTDIDGTIMGYKWSSDIDGTLGTQAQCSHSLSAGFHTVSFMVRDSNGEWGEATTNFVYVNTRPTAIIDSINPSPAIVTDKVTFTGHGTDPNGDGTVTGYEWKDGSVIISTSATFDKSDLGVGDHVISFRVRDDNGAWSPAVTRTITINNKPKPSAPVITEPSDMNTTLDAWTFIGTSGAGMTIKLYNGAVLARTVTASGSGAWTIQDVAINEGQNIYKAYATNSYGITSDASNSVTINRDASPPVTTASINPPIPGGANGWYKAAPLITLSVNKTASTYYQWDSDSAGGWLRYDQPINPDQGTHELYFYSVDGMGHTESYQGRTITVKYDGGQPIVTSIMPAEAAISGQTNTKVVVAYGDPVSGIDIVKTKLYVDSQPVAATVGQTSLSYRIDGVSAGSHQLKISVFDMAGHQTDRQWSFTTFYGDVTGDGKVDIFDLVAIGKAFGRIPSSPGWDDSTDLNADGFIDIFDLVIVGMNFNRVLNP